VSDYQRSTQAATLGALPEPIRAAIKARAESRHLTVADDAPAFVTHSVRLRKSGLFSRMTKTADPDTEHDTAMVLGPKDVYVCTHGEHRGTTVLVARLEDVHLDDRLGALRDEKDGISINGFPVSGEEGRASYYVGLGAPAGEAARSALADALRRAKAG
jgi:hypothetical protein